MPKKYDLFNLYNKKSEKEVQNNPVLPSSDVTEIEGEICKTVYISEDEAYAVFRLKDKEEKIITVTGPLAGAFEGQGIKATGKWENHSEHGRQFKVERFTLSIPKTAKGIEKYLSSGLIHGIGPKRAELIVSHFKEKTIDILDNYSARLTEVPGLGRKTLESIRTSWKEQAFKREITIFFQGLGISIPYCSRILKQFGPSALKIVKGDPYFLAESIHGIGFSKADIIARNLGIGHNDDKRLTAGVRYTLNKLSEAGHVCYPLNDFIRINAETLEVTEEESKKGVQLALEKKTIVIDTLVTYSSSKEYIYDSLLYYTEVGLARLIKDLLSVQTHKGSFLNSIKAKNDGKILFNEDQLAAINNISKSPFSIITGGPGVGKTTIVGEIIRRATCANLKIALAAPTGRAAKRLNETTNHHAQTIHRLLKWDPISKNFVHNISNKLTTDILVVDECSMIDITLALNLLKAVKKGTTVIMVGDADQLPSIGPGNVFKDLIESKICPVTFLKNIYRQSSDSKIIPAAHAVNRGKMPDLFLSDDKKLSDFYWIEQGEPEKISETILKLVTERIPKRFHLNPFKDIQILTPITKGGCGTIFLNELLQKQMNSSPKASFSYSGKTFNTGDKVMQTVNNYDKNVFNGDIGFITVINQEKKDFSVNYEDRVINYDFDESDELILAYAITIHKSQGSEFPAVIIPCTMSHYIMLQRNLIYTAITRAKKLLILIGTKKALGIAVSNCKVEPRFSGLLERLKKISKS